MGRDGIGDWGEKLGVRSYELAIMTLSITVTNYFSGSYTTPEEIEREATITTVATIIGIVGGTMAIAEQIRKWYLEYKQSKSG